MSPSNSSSSTSSNRHSPRPPRCVYVQSPAASVWICAGDWGEIEFEVLGCPAFVCSRQSSHWNREYPSKRYHRKQRARASRGARQRARNCSALLEHRPFHAPTNPPSPSFFDFSQPYGAPPPQPYGGYDQYQQQYGGPYMPPPPGPGPQPGYYGNQYGPPPPGQPGYPGPGYGQPPYYGQGYGAPPQQVRALSRIHGDVSVRPSLSLVGWLFLSPLFLSLSRSRSRSVYVCVCVCIAAPSRPRPPARLLCQPVRASSPRATWIPRPRLRPAPLLWAGLWNPSPADALSLSLVRYPVYPLSFLIILCMRVFCYGVSGGSCET